MSKMTKLLSGLLIGAIAFNAWQYYNPKVEHKYIPVSGKTPLPEIIYSTSESGANVATIKTPEPVLKPEAVASEELLNTVRNLKEVDSKSKITELTRVISNLELKLYEKDLVINDKENQRKVWQDKFNKVSVDNNLNTVEVLAEVSPVTVGYEKRERWFKAKDSFTAITSENPSIVFHGVEKYTVKNKEVKNFVEVTLEAEVGQFYHDTKHIKGLKNYDGMLNMTFNPDGKLRPFIKAGYRTYNFDYYSPYYSIGLKYLVFKF